MLTKAHVCGVSRSILGQPWRWRGTAADGHDAAFQPDDLIDQLLMARGVAREALERHRLPTLRGFMPDPSLFRDMDAARFTRAFRFGSSSKECARRTHWQRSAPAFTAHERRDQNKNSG